MSGRRARGFTLVEVVVALVLLAVILTGLISALVTFARTSDRVDQRTQAGDDVRLVYAFLSQSLGPADPRMRTRPDDAVTLSWMQGTATELVWLGLMPARHGVGGLFHLRLRLAPDTTGADRLMLDYLPYAGEDPPPDWGRAGTHLLLDGVSELQIAYRALDEVAWRAEWLEAQVLPARIRVSLIQNGSSWPALMVPVLAAQPRVDINASQPMGGG